MNKLRVNWWSSAALLLIVLFGAAHAAKREDAIQEAQKLIDQVKQLYDQGKYQQALPIAQQALEIREKEFGPEHPDTAEALSQLARLNDVLGIYSQAESQYQRVLAIREKTLGPEHRDTARSLNNLANLYQIIGAYAKAEQLYLRALAIREKTMGSQHPDTAASLNSLGILYLNIGEYAKAEVSHQQALAIRENVLGPEHIQTARSLNNLAILYRTTGAYAKAELLYRRALIIYEKALGPEHADTAMLLNNLAHLYWITGAYAKALPLHERALAIREKVLGPEHPDTAMSLNNLGSLYRDVGDFATAESLYSRALLIREKTLGSEHPFTASSLAYLGELYYRIGAYSKAEPLYRRAILIDEKVRGREQPDTARPLQDLGELYSMTGAYAKAELLLQRAHAIMKKTLGPRHPKVGESVTGLAVVNWRTGNATKALSLFEHAQSIEDKNTELFLLSGSESRNEAYLATLTGNISKRVSFSVTVPGHRSSALGFTSALQYKGRVLDATSNNVARLRRSVDAKDQSVFEQLEDIASRLSTLTYQGPGNLSPQMYQQRLNDLSQQQEQLEEQLAERSREFRRQVTPITIDSVRRAIPADSVLVEWLRYQPFDPKAIGAHVQKSSPRYVAYVLKHSSDPIVIDIGEASSVDSLVSELRDALGDSKRSDVKSRAIALSDKVLKPLRTHINGAQHLLISPDGALNLVPVAALVDESGRYLAEHTEITYLTSGRDLLRFASDANSRNSTVVANPDYGKPIQLLAQNDSLQPQRSADMDRSGFVFRPLTSTMMEAQALKSLLKLDDGSMLIGLNATEANLKQLHGPRILHIASHGFFLNDQEFTNLYRSREFMPQSENPLLRSGIALAGANERRSGANDDGILTALEAAQLDLHGTELVVLSACDSGVGQIQNGEGVYGLRRALVLAGAQTQIMSLWKVSDESTLKLMVDYYQRLLRGESRSAALYHAQKTLLGNPNESHPYYWAGFMSIGNWTPLPALR